MKTSDIFDENLVNTKLLAAFYQLTYQHDSKDFNICNYKHTQVYLKFIFLAADASPLLLPKVVGFDDVDNVDSVGKGEVELLQHRLHSAPGAAPHVHYHRETKFSDILAAKGSKTVTSYKEKRYKLKLATS